MTPAEGSADAGAPAAGDGARADEDVRAARAAYGALADEGARAERGARGADVRVDGGSPPGTGPRSAADERAAADTVDLRLPGELVALLAEEGRPAPPAVRVPAPGGEPVASPHAPGAPDAWGARGGSYGPRTPTGSYAPTGSYTSAGFDTALLDGLADWGPVSSRVGVFQLVPVRPDRDLALIARWMNDPAVAAFWELEGPESVTADHLWPQLGGDGRSMPCLGVLDGVPMSYFEIYRADLDPLARHYPARPHDTGLHLLVGGVKDRGKGLGSALLRAVSDHILDHRPRCTRVLAEPDLRNTPSVSAFLSGGFRFAAEVDLPDKRAALMVRDRAFRGHL